MQINFSVCINSSVVNFIRRNEKRKGINFLTRDVEGRKERKKKFFSLPKKFTRIKNQKLKAILDAQKSDFAIRNIIFFRSTFDY